MKYFLVGLFPTGVLPMFRLGGSGRSEFPYSLSSLREVRVDVRACNMQHATFIIHDLQPGGREGRAAPSRSEALPR